MFCCLSFTYIILNIVIRAVLDNHHGSQGSSEHGSAGLCLGQSGLRSSVKAEEDLPTAAVKGWAQASVVTAESCSPSCLLSLLKGHVCTNEMIMAAVRVGVFSCNCPQCLSAKLMACVWTTQRSPRWYLCLFPGIAWAWNRSPSVAARIGPLCCGGAEKQAEGTWPPQSWLHLYFESTKRTGDETKLWIPNACGCVLWVRVVLGSPHDVSVLRNQDKWNRGRHSKIFPGPWIICLVLPDVNSNTRDYSSRVGLCRKAETCQLRVTELGPL